MNSHRMMLMIARVQPYVTLTMKSDSVYKHKSAGETLELLNH
jgi:hypothetical protein